MIPMALAVRLDMAESQRKSHARIIPSRHRIRSGKDQQLAANKGYIGHGHHSHRQKASKWASPFTVGQHGTVEECLIMYTDCIGSSQLAEEIEELINKRFFSNTPEDMPCTANVLIAMVYYA